MPRSTFAIVTAMAALWCPAASAQTINLWPGVAPGSETWTHEERTLSDTPLGTVIVNVVRPTITAYLPEPSKATGTGVIVAPGGAFVALAIDLEGHSVARWLQARGIAAFVLKYRLVEKRGDGIPSLDMDEAAKFGIADGIQALALVRSRTAEWRLDARRIGILGFSAGGMVAVGTTLHEDAMARPNFAAMIYGGPFGRMPPIPPTLPPLFLAWAQDDSMARVPLAKFYEALMLVGHRPELHLFGRGGHGFGMRQQGTSSDRWPDAFLSWLQSTGFAPQQ